MSAFRKGFALTAIPIVVVSILSTAGAVGSEGLYFVWYLGAGLWALAILTAIVFTIAVSKRKTASGMWAGLGVGFLALTATCFVNVATILGGIE